MDISENSRIHGHKIKFAFCEKMTKKMQFSAVKSSVYIDKYELLWYTIYTTKYLTNRKKDVTAVGQSAHYFLCGGAKSRLLRMLQY